MKANNTDKTTRELAIEWWDNQNRYDKILYFITFKEKNFSPANNEMELTGREIEIIYKAEHPQPIKEVLTPAEREVMGEWTKGEWAVRDYEVIGPFGSNKSICEMTGDFMGKAEKKANANRIVTCVNGYDKLKADNEALVSALKDMVNSLDIYVNSPEGHGCVPDGFTAPQYEQAKALINTIEGNK